MLRAHKVAHRIQYDGDLKKICQQLVDKTRELQRGGVVEVVVRDSSMHAETLDDLRALRRLCKQLPFFVVGELTTAPGKSALLDLIVAMLCDVVRTPEKASKNYVLSYKDNAGARAEFKESLAADMWHMFTGEDLNASPDLHMLNFGGISSEQQAGIAQIVPQYWMAFRNCGMARPGDLPTTPDAMPQWQQPLQAAHSASPGCMAKSKKIPPHCPDPFRCDLFNCYFAPKVLVLFSMWDAGVVASLPTEPEACQAARAGQHAACKDGCAHLELTSDILLCSVDDIMGLVKRTSDQLVQTGESPMELHIVLKDGHYASSSNVFPIGVAEHMDIYKWHRKWEQFIGSLRNFKMICTISGKSICLPLMELFIASDVRIWKSEAESFNFGAAPFLYTPGPNAMRHLMSLPLCTLRRFLLCGLSVQEADELTLISDVAPEVVPVIPFRGGRISRLRSRCDSMALLAMDAAGGSTPMSASQSYSPGAPSWPISPTSPTLARRRSLSGSFDMTPRRWKWAGDFVCIPPPTERAAPKEMPGSCALLGYGLATPGEEHRYTQEMVCEALKVDNPRDRSILTAAHIKTRYLADLKEDLADPASTTPKRLEQKQRHWAPIMLAEAIRKACKDAGVATSEIRHLSICCSSGYMLPGLTAYVVKDKELGIPDDIDRKDIVGMGCHAGLNSVKSAAAWAAANPGQYAISCGVEVLSASYVWGSETKRTLNTVLVNSLFGDGCFAAVLRASPPGETVPPVPAYIELPQQWWGALCVTGALQDMIYEYEESEGKTQFLLSELAPYHVGQALFSMMNNALRRGVPVHRADHVITHTGGKTVLDCSAMALGLDGPPASSLPFTVAALRDYGNQSSASFMFAFDKLVNGGTVCAKDSGLFVTMGPGAGLEYAMWTAGDRFPKRVDASRLQELAAQSLYASEMLGREVVSVSSDKIPVKASKGSKVPRSMKPIGGAIAGLGATAATTAAGVGYMSPPMAAGCVSTSCFGGIAAIAIAVAAVFSLSSRISPQEEPDSLSDSDE